MKFEDCPHNGGLVQHPNKKFIECNLCGYAVFMIDDGKVYKAVKISEMPIEINIEQEPRLKVFL